MRRRNGRGPRKRHPGIISFWEQKWSANEAGCNIAVEVSTDNGANWREVGKYRHQKMPTGKIYARPASPEDVRSRLRRTSGAHTIDDVAVSNYSTGVSDPAADANGMRSLQIRECLP